MGIISDKLFRIAKLSPEDMKVELLELAAQQQKLERRRATSRKTSERWRAKRHGDCHGDSGVTVTPKPPEDVTVTVTVNAPIYSKEVSKKESKIYKQDISNRRVSKKRSQIDPELVCSSRNREDAFKAGMPESSIDTEWVNFVDHHLHKGTLGLDWNAGWRRWCANHVKWKISAKPTTQSKWDALYEQLDRVSQEDRSQKNGTQGSHELGQPTIEIIPPSRPSDSRTGGGHRFASLSVFQDSGDQDLFPRRTANKI